ncbi:hypothetical protein ACFFX0_13040 [Citricoccus parietis]|uniref:Uncharacterized protein n=1 Tax=Citricoccus parietis TaxID=592307 RepID=A0ABV5FZI3_9MICC
MRTRRTAGQRRSWSVTPWTARSTAPPSRWRRPAATGSSSTGGGWRRFPCSRSRWCRRSCRPKPRPVR